MCDPNTALGTIEAAAKATNTLGKIVEKIFGPSWKKKQVDADAYSAEVIMKMIRDNPDMEIIYDDSKLHIKKRNVIALANRADERKALEAVRQQYNLENVIGFAEGALNNKEKVNDKEIDEDFITRLFDIAKDANKREMQFIWGKILAQEVVEPGSFSLRTLEVVRNLNKLEEEVFHKVATVTLKSGRQYFLPANLDLTAKYEVDFNSLLILQECGLIQSFEALPLNINLGREGIVGLENNKSIIVVKRKGSGKSLFSVNAYKFTKAGQELLCVLTPRSEMKYAFEYGKYLQLANPDLSVNVYEVISKKDNGEIVFSDKPINFD